MNEPVYRMLAWYRSYDLAGRLRDGLRRDRGASAVEYGLLVALIAGAILTLVFVFGGRVKGMFSSACDSMTPDHHTDACS